jgi:hypothetical protein
MPASHLQKASRLERNFLKQLIMIRLALVTAEDEKLQLQFGMKTLRARKKAVQERLAAHASRLDVKLSEAKDELGTCR